MEKNSRKAIQHNPYEEIIQLAPVEKEGSLDP